MKNIIQNTDNNGIRIADLYDKLLDDGYQIIDHGKYQLLKCENLKVLSYGGRYVTVKYLSRHRTGKHLVRLDIRGHSENSSVTVTTDHICMVYDKDRILQNTDAKNLSPGDYVSLYDNRSGKEYIGAIERIKDLGITDEYVYDMEVDDDTHSFYANDVLIHNSIFLNLEPVVNHMKKEMNLPEHLSDWKQKDRDLLWKNMSDFVDNKVNCYVRGLVHDFCHTSKQQILTYELEYMADIGIYERMKHYSCHKIFDEGDPVDKIKYSGIEMKKATLPKFVKKYLQEIYDGVILHNWNDSDYQDYINNLYNQYLKFSIDEISMWKGYNAEREAAGFLQMAQSINPQTGKTVGTTGIAKAATYYNQIIEKMGLGKKYEQLRIGDKCRFLYIDENNKYRINVMAYKDGQWPVEFDQIFKPDYKTMFEKTVLDALKSFRAACKFSEIDPSKQVVFDIFSL